MPFKVTYFGINRKPICDFLLVINSNSHPISHYFQVIEIIGQICGFRLGVPLYNTLIQGEPQTQDHETRTIALLCKMRFNILNRLGVAHDTIVTDGQTDRQNRR